MAQSFSFRTPWGRLVGGSFLNVQTKDHENQPLDPAKHNWFVAIAFPKTAAAWWDEQGELGAMFTAIRQAGADHYKGQEFSIPGFKWKIDDGDNGVNQKGIKLNTKEGYAGHWVVKFTRYVSVGSPVKIGIFGRDGEFINDVNDTRLALGNYFAISGSSKANGKTGAQAGVYMNMDRVMFGGFGTPIVSGPTMSESFSGLGSLPPGASAGPVGAPPLPSAPSLPLPTPPAPAAPAAPGAVPAPNFAQGGGYAPVEVKRIYQGVAYTEAALRAGGHTDAMLVTYPIAQ